MEDIYKEVKIKIKFRIISLFQLVVNQEEIKKFSLKKIVLLYIF